MNFDIKTEMKKIILKSLLKNSFNKTHSNSKYSLGRYGISWNFLRSPVKSKILFWHFTRFVDNNIFFKLYNRIRSLYIDEKYSLLLDFGLRFQRLLETMSVIMLKVWQKMNKKN